MIGQLEGSEIPVKLVADALEPVAVQLPMVDLMQHDHAINIFRGLLQVLDITGFNKMGESAGLSHD